MLILQQNGTCRTRLLVQEQQTTKVFQLRTKRTYSERLLCEKETNAKIGKRVWTPLKGKGASKEPTRPSNAARQYGASDDSGPLCCKAIVKGEEIVALVDTGSALTLMSKALYDRIARKMVNPKLKESNVNIMGIAGLRKRCEGRIENIPIKFKEKEWKLNAETIPHPSVDVILGQNFLMEVMAEISLPKLQMTLGNGKERIDLYREPLKYISLCLMAKGEKKDWWKKKKEVPKSEWKCENGAQENTCMRWRGYEETEEPIPCSKCKDKYWEKSDYNDAKARYNEEKMDSHMNGWRAVSEGSKGPGEVLSNEYELYVKGSELKMNGEVVSQGVALGWVGVSWTKFHPEGNPPNHRPQDPAYEWRSEKWKRMFVTEPMQINQPEIVEKINNIDMEIDESVFYVECHNVQNYLDERNVSVKESNEGVVIDDDLWTWNEIQRVQARFTQEPRGNQLPYHWKGPDN